eukprot:2167265-Amphidinium_carterae.1
MSEKGKPEIENRLVLWKISLLAVFFSSLLVRPFCADHAFFLEVKTWQWRRRLLEGEPSHVQSSRSFTLAAAASPCNTVLFSNQGFSILEQKRTPNINFFRLLPEDI